MNGTAGENLPFGAHLHWLYHSSIFWIGGEDDKRSSFVIFSTNGTSFASFAEARSAAMFVTPLSCNKGHFLEAKGSTAMLGMSKQYSNTTYAGSRRKAVVLGTPPP
jgi:hypothetical protein